MRCTALAVCLITLVCSAAAHAADGADARLAAGEVVVTRLPAKATNMMAPARAQAVIDAPMDAVWSVVRSCANYKKTMAGVKDSAVLAEAAGTMTCKVTVDLPFPFSDLTSVTAVKFVEEPGKRYLREWTLVEGDYDSMEGSWLLVPFGDGSRTLATYTISVKPKTSLPDSVLELAQTSRLPDMMQGLRANAAKNLAAKTKVAADEKLVETKKAP